MVASELKLRDSLGVRFFGALIPNTPKTLKKTTKHRQVGYTVTLHILYTTDLCGRGLLWQSVTVICSQRGYISLDLQYA